MENNSKGHQSNHFIVHDQAPRQPHDTDTWKVLVVVKSYYM